MPRDVSKLKLELPIVLPDVPDARDDCVRTLVRMLRTKEGILGAAREHGADLIVVGSHGRHGLALLLGSTANAVLHGAPCDVLAVRIR